MASEKPNFGKILLGSLAICWHHRVSLAKALLVPFVLLVAIDTAEFFEPSLFILVLLLVLKLAVFTIFAVTIHRIILLGPGSVPSWGLFRWTGRETYFAAHVAALSFLAVILIWVPMFTTGHLGIALGVILAVYVCSRLSLVFPASAIGQGVTIELSWRLSRRHQILMLCVVALVPVLFAIPTVLVLMLPYTFFLESTLDTLFTVFVIGSLSLAYSEIQRFEYES